MQFARHGNETVCLALEVIHNHAYEHSRFLRGASLNWDQFDLDDAPAPLILVGSAGSGKTALTLEKLRLARGRVLYVTQSAFLAQSAQAMYFAHGFEAGGQEPEFLSYREFIETLQVPACSI